MTARMLALETSGLYGSVALVEAGIVRAEMELRPPRRTAQALAPAVSDLLRQLDWSPRDIDCVAVTTGPGSFTGLRVGVVTAKTFAYAVGAAVVGVDSLATIVEGVPGEFDRAITIIDAQRRELFSASWRRDESGEWMAESPTELIDVEEWLGRLPPSARVVGPGVEKVRLRLPANVSILDGYHSPRAEAVARIGWREYAGGRATDVWSLAPRYFRLSAAEEKAGHGGAKEREQE